MSVNVRPGNLPHVFWIDIKSNGVFVECAVMKRDNIGNIFFFPLNALDNIDRKRLARILTNRNAQHFELWDLMSNITLNNGVNALAYFHQLVQMMTPSGQVMKPQAGVIGAPDGVIDTRPEEVRKELEEATTMAAKAAAEAAAAAAVKTLQTEGTRK